MNTQHPYGGLIRYENGELMLFCGLKGMWIKTGARELTPMEIYLRKFARETTRRMMLPKEPVGTYDIADYIKNPQVQEEARTQATGYISLLKFW
jgi:hypothetical protein